MCGDIDDRHTLAATVGDERQRSVGRDRDGQWTKTNRNGVRALRLAMLMTVTLLPTEFVTRATPEFAVCSGTIAIAEGCSPTEIVAAAASGWAMSMTDTESSDVLTTRA